MYVLDVKMPRVEIENETHKLVKLFAVKEDITVARAYSKLLLFSLNHIKSIKKLDDFKGR